MNEEPIRVAQIIGKWVGGGVEAVVMNYYKHIDRSKIQFDFICDEDSSFIPYEEIEKLGGKVILVPPYQKVFKYHKELTRVLKEGKYKIVHSHINTLSVFSLWAAKSAGVPIRIAHSHSTTNKKEKKKNLLKQILRPFNKLFATDYMCCSESAGRWLFGNKEYDNGNVYVLNNAIDLNKFKYDENTRRKIRNQLNISEGTLVIGHVGRFVEQKNHRFLLDIFNEIHKEKENSILLLIGQGPLVNEITEKAKKLKIENCIKFLGQRDDIENLYQAMDLFLFPSLYEGLGMVLIEAQCSNLPCVASTEVPQIVKINNNVKFVNIKEDAEIWKKSVYEMLDITRRKDTNENEIFAKYDIEKEANKLLIEYRKRGNLDMDNFLTIEEVKKIELNILEAIDEICEENNIEYYLCGGSMIGAVRHQGFIPWDDDIDIFLKRSEYEKLINILKKQKKYDSIGVVDDNNKGYYYPFAKAVDKNTVAKMEDNVTEHGIWVDIFPIDFLPENKRKREKLIKKCYLYRAIIIAMTTDFKAEKEGKKVKYKKILNKIAQIVGKDRIYKKYNKLIKEASKNEESNYVACLCPTYKTREIFLADKLFLRKKYKFEGKEFWGVKDYDYYLSQLYGDYMTLPPVEKRRVHGIKAWRKS